MSLKLFSTQIEEERHKDLRILAAVQGRKIIDLVDEAIKDLVDKYKEK